ncbi:TonB-dependent receptor domain-containing protein [Sphingomonas soli]|uniref:TonB-dependent receptor domain-containing protein n=1 Tax=Sphingomonas soli TaxID=266127 RepID=UPI000A92C50E|nr:TonB-dependent receptor [Sphingomonas soli]
MFKRVCVPSYLTLALVLSLGHAPAALAADPTEATEANLDAGDDNDPIVVTASGFEQKPKNAPASITVIDRKELETKRFGSLAEALSDVEGVDVGATAGKTGGLNISVRGMPSDYTLVLIDGRRQNAPGSVTPNGFGESSTSFLPPFSAIQQIEVVRGPMSTLYGSDAMGGVVNIITRKTSGNWVGTVSAESTVQFDGDYGNIVSTNGYVQGPIIPNLIGLSVRGSYWDRGASNLFYTDASGKPVEVSKRGPSPVAGNIWSAGGKLTLTPHADHDIWIEADVARQWYDNSKSQLGTGTVAGGYGPELRFNRNNYALAHSWRAGFATIDTTLSRNETITIGRTVPPGTPGKVAGSPRTLDARNTIFDSRAVIPAGFANFTVGGQYWKADMVDAVAVDKYEFVQWALFAESQIKLAKQFSVTLGGRYDDHDTFGGKFSPRAYAVWNASDALTIKGGVSRGFKTPRLDQIAPGITGFTAQGTRPSIGTPGLKPETSTSYEAGVYFDDGGLLSGNVTVFHNEFKDKIATGIGVANCSFAGSPNRPGCISVGNFPAVDLFDQTVNIDEAVTRGLEVAAKMRFSRALSLNLNYTLSDSEQKTGINAGNPLIGTPRHMLNGNLRWQATDKLNAWIRADIRSSRFRGVGVEQTALGDYKGYALFHLGGNLQVTEKFKLSATIFNLLDKDFGGYRPYRNGAVTAYGSEFANLQEPRRIWLSANIDF